MINLNEILEEYIPNECEWFNLAIHAMKEACDKTVNLCVANAEAKYRWDGDIKGLVDEMSILKTKDQILNTAISR